MNPIIEKDEINFENLGSFTMIVFKKYYKILFLLIFVFCAYIFLRSPAYSSSVSFYTNYNQSSKIPSSLGFINSLAGVSSDSNLGFSVSDYIKSDNFFNYVLKREYSINGQQVNLVEHLGKKYNKIFSLNPFITLYNIEKKLQLSNSASEYDRKLLAAKERLLSDMSHSEDKQTFLHTISFISINDPELSKLVVEVMFDSIIKYANEITNSKGLEKVAFINSRLLDVKSDLYNAENDLLLFLENNKSINSPSLNLQLERLQRNIMLYNQLFLSMSDQLEIAKIDSKDNTSSVFLLDAPEISPYKPGRGLLEKIFLLTLIFYIPALSIEAFKNRNELFI